MSCKGVRSDETRRKMSLSHTGKSLSEAHRRKLSEKSGRKKPIVCVETDVVYESAYAAARVYECNPDCIYNVLKGTNKTSCGLHWRYATEEDLKRPVCNGWE